MYKKLQDVVDNDLCTGCGTCVSICPTSCLEIDVSKPYPKQNEKKCIDCDLCYKVCPGHSVNFNSLSQSLFKKQPKIGGTIKQAFIAFSSKKEIRKNASSGGVISSLLLYAMDKKLIKGAILVKMNEKKPWLAEEFVAKSKNEIMKAMQAKYVVVPLNSQLKKIKNENARFALVGLPCHIHGYHKFLNKKIKDRIAFTLGSYCGFNLQLKATLHLIKKMGVDNLNSVKRIEYRGGGWPGGFKITLKNGRTLFLEKFKQNYITPLFVAPRCKTCIDLSNHFADISIGDAWFPELINKKEGWSLVLARSDKGLKLLKQAEKEGYIKLRKISIETALSAHSHTLNWKEIGGQARIKLYRLFNKPIPAYNYDLKISNFRLFREAVFLSTLNLLSTPFSRKIVALVPLSVLGGAVSFYRRLVTRRSRLK